MTEQWGRRCTHRAFAYVYREDVGFVAACPQHGEGARFFERLVHYRRCDVPLPFTTQGPVSTFSLVIAEAARRCRCGALAELCGPCAAERSAIFRISRAGEVR